MGSRNKNKAVNNQLLRKRIIYALRIIGGRW